MDTVAVGTVAVDTVAVDTVAVGIRIIGAGTTGAFCAESSALSVEAAATNTGLFVRSRRMAVVPQIHAAARHDDSP